MLMPLISYAERVKTLPVRDPLFHAHVRRPAHRLPATPPCLFACPPPAHFVAFTI